MQTLDPSQPRKKPFRWGFFSAAALIVFLMCVGQAVGVMLMSFGPAAAQGVELSFGERLAGLQLKDWIFVAFLISSAVFLWLQRTAVQGFFRSMHAGVSLVALSCLAIVTGVLIPQIDGFEDPTERVTPANYEEQYKAFAWAEAYFAYHLIHPYGIGMPEAALPPQVQSGLDRFGAKYGTEERDNREKQMKAAFSGNSKTQEIGALLQRHDGFFHGFFDVATALHLNRTYKSYWFATLLGLLGVGVLFNTFNGRRESWLSARKAGHFVVHIGVMILLVGGGISKLNSDRGIIHLDLSDPPQDEYWAYNSRLKRTRMPFSIKLERFARKDWPTLEVGFLDTSFSSRPPEYTLWPGREVDLDSAPDAAGEVKPRIRIKVLSMAERAQIKQPKLWDADTRDDPKGYGPLAELTLLVPDQPDHVQNGAVAPRRESTLLLRPGGTENLAYDPLGKFRLATAHGDDIAAARHELFPPIEDQLGTLEIRDSARGEVESSQQPFRLGGAVTTATGYSIEVQEATANFQLDEKGRTEIRDPRPLSQQDPRNPGVWVQITPPGGGTPERRLLLESVDWETHDQQKSFPYPGLVLKLHWERWRTPGPPRFVLHWGSARGPLLLAEDGTESEVHVDRPLALAGDTEIVVKQLLHNALFEKTIEFLAPHIEGPHFDEDFYSPDPSGLELQVTISEPGTTSDHVEKVRMASTERGLANLWQSPDERFYLRYYENDRAFPFEWRSVLSIYEKDAGGKLQRVETGNEADREIRVNDYLYYRGYRFFQTNAVPELPTYSGIGVVYDPGIPVVLFGMYTIILGAILAFIVRPIVDAYGKRARGSRGNSGGNR